MNNNSRTNNQVVIYKRDGQIVRIENKNLQKHHGQPRRNDEVMDAEWYMLEPRKKGKKHHKHKKHYTHNHGQQERDVIIQPQYVPMVRQESALDRFCNDLVDNGQLDISINRNGTQIRYSHKSGFNIGFNLNNHNDT